MIVEVRYLDALPPWKTSVYAFEVPDGTEVGAQFVDYGHPREPIVEVVALGSDYAGPVRELRQQIYATSEAQPPGDASTPAAAPFHGAREGEEGT